MVMQIAPGARGGGNVEWLPLSVSTVPVLSAWLAEGDRKVRIGETVSFDDETRTCWLGRALNNGKLGLVAGSRYRS